MGNPTKKHPRTGETIHPLWIRPDGRAMWPIMGASPDDPSNGDPAPTGDPKPAPPDPAAAKTPPWGDDGNFNAEKAWELIQNLRAEKSPNADLQRELDDLRSGQQATMDAVATALGLKGDDTPPDPAALAEKVKESESRATDAETRAATAERNLAVFLAAGTDYSAKALLDSQTFVESIKDLDPTDATAIGEAIKKAAESNPHFKATPATPPFPGGPRTSARTTDVAPGLPRLRDAYAQSSK